MLIRARLYRASGRGGRQQGRDELDAALAGGVHVAAVDRCGSTYAVFNAVG